ncbi:MAG: hypothetical protein IV100_02020, partial [Myxococcales bacterium]|nr:hypothetical protein [Myxococcales bacterium]
TTPDAGTDSTDGTDGATDATDGTTDATDGTTDATDGTTDATDATDGTTDATDATDGTTDATDATDGTTDSTDGTTDSTDGTDGVDGADNGACNSPPTFGENKTRVVSITLPTAAGDYKCDANADGAQDAKDGNLNSVLANPMLSSLFDVNALLAQNIAEGDIVLLADLNGTWMNMYLGSKVDPAGACFDIATTPENYTKIDDVTATTWDGASKCDYGIDPTSFAADGCPVITIANSSITGGKVQAGPADFDFSLPLGELTLDVAIENGQVQADATGAFRMTNGRLCGEIPYLALEAAFNKVCTDDPEQTLCTYKTIALGLIKSSCAGTTDADKRCSIVVGLETAEAGAMTVDAE